MIILSISIKNMRCIPNSVLMHYSMKFFSINSASSVLTENSETKKYTLNTQMVYLNSCKTQSVEMWNTSCT